MIKVNFYIVIRKNDFLTGFSGCNKFSGNVISDEINIKIGPLMSTRMACPAMAVENQFHKLLTSADNYHIKGESLELFQRTPDNNRPVAKFIAVYF